MNLFPHRVLKNNNDNTPMPDDSLNRFLAGTMTPQERADALNPPLSDEMTEVLLACCPADYSASAIARAVEDCDAQLLSLAVTGMRDHRGFPVVALKVNVADADGVARSLSRYGYEPFFTGSRPDSALRHRAQERANELIHYLEL